MADVSKLVFSILKFLDDQKRSGQHDDKATESLEVAVQCLQQVYKLNTSEEQFVRKYSIPQNLLDIFNSHQNETKSDISSLSLQEALIAQKEEAERLKNKGNEFMKSEKYSDALESYSQAIRLDAKNAIYSCNRAAAFSKLSMHQQAIEDCNRALAIAPGYSKAYGRMGIAYTGLNDHKSAFECYRRAIEIDPDNQTYHSNLKIAEQKLKEAALQAGFNIGPAESLGVLGGLRNLDFASLFTDPNIFNVATAMMSNPQYRQMLTNFVSGSSPPTAGGYANLLQASQQMASQQMASQQMASQQMASQQMASQQMASQQMASQQMASQQMASQQMASQQMASQQVASQQVASQQMVSQQMASQMQQANPELVQHLRDSQNPPNDNSSGQNNSGDSNPPRQ